MVVDASNVWDRILGRIAVIPFPNHPTFVPSATFRKTSKRWATSPCTKEGTVSIARVRSGANNTAFFFGPFGDALPSPGVNPLEGSPSVVAEDWDSEGAPGFQL